MSQDHINFDSFCQYFNTESSCMDALVKARWPDGFRCSSCSSSQFYLVSTRRLPLFECRFCRRQTSVIAGTIMEGSKTPLTKWFKAMFLIAQPHGISSAQLSRIIQVTYKTAWLMSHKIRHSIQLADANEPLSEVVHIDPLYYGYTYYLDARQPLLLGTSLDDNKEPSYIKIKQPHPSHVSNESRSIQRSGFRDFLRDHLDIHASPVTSLFTYNKRHPSSIQISRKLTEWLNNTFCGIGPKHLQSYLDEFCFRENLNHRKISTFYSLLNYCASTATLIYKELIKFKPVLPVPWSAWGSKAKWKGYHLSLWGA